MKKILIIFGDIEFVGNTATIHEVKRADLHPSDTAEAHGQALVNAHVQDAYIIPSLWGGLISWAE